MNPSSAGMTFNEWVSHVFNHDVPEIATYVEIMDEIEWDGSAEQKIAYMTRLWGEPHLVLHSYSDRQLAQGLEWLISAALSGYPLGLCDSSVPLDLRVQCIRNMYTVYEQVFAVRCSPELACSGRLSTSSLNGVCYMWWDILPFWSKSFPVNERVLDETALTVMKSTLSLDSLPCQEGALHGLGHWCPDYPERIRTSIGEYLDRSPAIPPELRVYALNAQRGYVL
jgi:hypothetical protein